jgi:3-methyladenine DNA glycosylase/8-oxoguanine DNA glycosylase
VDSVTAPPERNVVHVSSPSPDACVDWHTPRPIDLVRTLARLGRGGFDPAHRVLPDSVVWRTTRTDVGPASYRLAQRGRHDVRCDAWGPGAHAVVAGLSTLLGEGDDPDSFEPGNAVLEQAHRRHPGLRIPRSGRVLESLVPAVLEQRVHTRLAWSSWAWLLRHHGEPAPGPAPEGMRVPPDAEGWRAVPQWDWHRAGVDPRRMKVAVACARAAERLEECVDLPAPEAHARMRAVPGVGVWTAAEVAQRALGDADALSVGDLHLATSVGWALAGRTRFDDAQMIELLEPWRPHRYRVVRLLEVTRLPRRPRFAPRLRYQDHRGH